MGTTILKDQEIWFDAYRLTTRLNSVAFSNDSENPDDTTFGDATRSVKEGGLEIPVVSVQGFYDADPYDAALQSALNVANKPMSWAVSSTEGVRAYTMNMLLGSYNPAQGEVGQMHTFNAGGKATKSPLVYGTLMLNNSAINSSTQGTQRQLGTVSATQKLYAALHVLSVSGTSTPTLTVVVKSDDNSGFSTPTDRITFDAATAIGSQFKSLSGPITDDRFRIYWTVSGSSPVFSAVLVLGIR